MCFDNYSCCVIWRGVITYVGETKRTLNIRAEEHITANKSASKKSHTAEHCWKYSHDFNWEHKNILDFEKNWKTRTIKESIYSEENEHHINGISFKLPNIWEPILQENKAKENNCQNYNTIKLSPRYFCHTRRKSQLKLHFTFTNKVVHFVSRLSTCFHHSVLRIIMNYCCDWVMIITSV